MRALLRELSDNEDDIIARAGVDIPQDSQQPWLHDYCSYMDAFEQVPEDWSTIQWLSPALRPSAWHDGAWVRWGANRSPDADRWFAMTRYSRFVT